VSGYDNNFTNVIRGSYRYPINSAYFNGLSDHVHGMGTIYHWG
jgi:hypothetical protein